MKLYVSNDNGALYEENEIDPDDKNFYPVEVPDTFSLKAEQLCGRDGNLMEILLSAKIAKLLKI